MAPPADIASASEVLAVSDRTRWSGQFVNEGFKLGNYDVVDVDREWSSTSSAGFGPWSKETKTTGFSYALAAGGKKLPGKCSSVSSSQAVGGFSWGHMKIACACDGEEGNVGAGHDRQRPHPESARHRVQAGARPRAGRAAARKRTPRGFAPMGTSRWAPSRSCIRARSG